MIIWSPGFKIPFIAKLIAVVQFGVKAIFSEGKPIKMELLITI